jgi:hypothetical protein
MKIAIKSNWPWHLDIYYYLLELKIESRICRVQVGKVKKNFSHSFFGVERQ